MPTQIFAVSRTQYFGGFVDMHCHILPGVDDGAVSISQSLSMLRIAAGEGITHTVATPHLVIDGSERHYRDKIQNAYETVCQAVREEGISITVLLGFELMLSPSLLHAENLLDYTISGTNRLLVEPNCDRPQEVLDDLLYELDHINAGLILAHPERNGHLAGNLEYLWKLLDRGVLIQLNSGSITGQWGRSVARASKRLTRLGLVHMIGTDAHSDRARAPKIRNAVSMLSRWVGVKRAEEIACLNAGKILGFRSTCFSDCCNNIL